MATTVDELRVLISANAKEFNKGLQGVQSQLNSLQTAANKASSKISVGAIAAGNLIAKGLGAAFKAIAQNMDDAITRLDTLNNFPRVMSNLGISAKDAQASINVMAEKLLGLPTTLDDAALAVQRFTSANGNVKASTEMFLALNNAILAGGAGTELQSSALEQLSQAYAKGKPDMMEWRTMMMAMPAQLKQVATAMGYASSEKLGEALRAGTVSMNDFMVTVTKLNKQGLNGFKSFEEQARNSTNGVATSFKNLKTAIVKGLQQIMDAIGQANIAGFINGISRAIGTVANYVAAFVKVIKVAVGYIAALFGKTSKVSDEANSAAGSVESIGGAASAAADNLDDATSSAKKLNKQLAAFDEMNVLKEDTSSDSGSSSGGGADASGIDLSDIWGELENTGNKADEIAARMQAAFEKAWAAMSKSKALRALGNAVKKVFDTTKTQITTALGSVRDIWNTTWEALKNTADTYGDQMDEAFAGLFNSLGDVASSAVQIAFAPLNGFLNGFKAVWAETAQSVTDSMAIIAISVAENVGTILDQVNETLQLFLPYFEQGFENLGGLMAEMVTDWYNSAAEWLPKILDNFSTFFTNLNQGLIQPAVKIIGTIWQDFTEDLKTTWEEHGKVILDGIGQFINGIVEWFNKVWTEVLEPIIKPFLEEFERVWKEHLRPALQTVMDFVGKVIECALTIWNNFIHPIVMWLTDVLSPIFTTVFSAIGGVLNTFFATIGDIVKGIFTVLGGLIDFITGVFSGNWEKAWEGVKNIFKGIVDTLGAIFKAPINFIIDIINGFIEGLNHIKIPDWVPGIGGFGINIQKLNKLATGGIIDKATLAVVGESGKEAVMPLEHNTGWITKLAQTLAERGGVGGGDQPIYLTVEIGGEKLIDQVIEGINDRSQLTNRAAISY